MNITLSIVTNALIVLASCKSINNNSNENGAKVIENELKCDTMTLKEFYKLAEGFGDAMRRKEKFSDQKLAILVKLYNTFHVSEIHHDKTRGKFATEFIKNFETDYLSPAITRLEATYGVGMTIYSKKCDLFIGIGSEFRCRDIYEILR